MLVFMMQRVIPLERGGRLVALKELGYHSRYLNDIGEDTIIEEGA